MDGALINVLKFSCSESAVDLVKNLEAAKEFERIQNIFQGFCLSAFLYLRYEKKYPIDWTAGAYFT